MANGSKLDRIELVEQLMGMLSVPIVILYLRQ